MPQYIAIDLKSFYASVECVERGLDPLTTNLVVADESRTEKTICLAVSPSLKKYGIPGRARLFEVVQKVKQVNRSRKTGEPELSYIAAPPRMALYVEYSTRIYDIYLKYVAPEDIHVYSIDEVFMDVTHYLKTYGMTAYQLAQTIILDVQDHIGITATAGIGTNLYLCKIAMDIVAKHIDADENGVRIAQHHAVLVGYRPRNGKPGFERRRRTLRCLFGVHIQLPVREAVAHAGKSVRDKAQARQAAQLVAPVIRHVAVHGIEEERVGVAGEHRFNIARALLGGLQIPLRRDAGVGHHQLFLFIHLQQRLATQPVEQLIGIRRFQQWFQTILRLVAADTGKDRQQV